MLKPYVKLFVQKTALCLISVAGCLVSADETEVILGNSTIYENPQFPEMSSDFRTLMTILDEYTPEASLKFEQKAFSRSFREISQGDAHFHYPMICQDLVGEGKDHLLLGDAVAGWGVFSMAIRADSGLTRSRLLEAGYDINAGDSDVLKAIFTENEFAALQKLPKFKGSKGAYIAYAENTLGRSLTAAESDLLLKRAFPYRIAMPRLIGVDMHFPTVSANNTNSGLFRVAAGRVDAYVSEHFFLKLSLDESKANDQLLIEPIHIFDNCFVVANNATGQRINKIISAGLRKLNEDEKYLEMYKDYHDFVQRLREKFRDEEK